MEKVDNEWVNDTCITYQCQEAAKSMTVGADIRARKTWVDERVAEVQRISRVNQLRLGAEQEMTVKACMMEVRQGMHNRKIVSHHAWYETQKFGCCSLFSSEVSGITYVCTYVYGRVG
jgi:hypothetical protein